MGRLSPFDRGPWSVAGVTGFRDSHDQFGGVLEVSHGPLLRGAGGRVTFCEVGRMRRWDRRRGEGPAVPL